MRGIMSCLLTLLVPACSPSAMRTTGESLTTDDLTLDQSFDGWQFFLSGSGATDARMGDVWRIENGVLLCTGKPLGYLYTRKDYTDFVLKLRWRWPPGKEPGKGGVLLRMTGSHKIWPKSLEAQINAGDAGDFWGLNGYRLSGPAARTTSLEHEKFGRLIHLEQDKAVEKPAGEWNDYEIVVQGENVTLMINGQVVNEAAGCDVVAGKVCLTAEGSEIHFRDVRLTPLDPGPQREQNR